jgi:voltage-gated potassium channel
MIAAIFISGALAVLETDPMISDGRGPMLAVVERLFGLLFALEYGLRLWIAARAGAARPWRARLQWALSPAALVDLVAFAPMLLSTGGAPTALLRFVRLARMLRLAKLGRFSTAWSLIAQAVSARRYELLLSLYAALAAMLTSASLLYLVEGPLQPDKFGSIPRALWWSAMTLTTIGYGDVYPLSPLGRLLASATAVVGIGLIAAPTGILAAAFSAAYQRRRRGDSAPAGEGG